MRILILDLTHAGDRIGAEYVRAGHEVSIVDVYRTAKAPDMERVAAAGMRLLPEAPAEEFDLAVLPVHCPARFLGQARPKKVISHHEAVGEIVSFPHPVIEVTGAAGKTSTCFAIAQVLASAGNKVLLHTSRGNLLIDKGVKVLNEIASIAPASLVELSKTDGYDVAVLEESLGGTGLGQVCIVTTIGDDYAIAGGTKKAFDGKVQMVSLARNTVVFPKKENDIWAKHVRQGTRTLTFGRGGDVEVGFDDVHIGVPASASLSYLGRKIEFDISSTILGLSYATALEAATAACISFGMDLEDVVHGLRAFRGVPGRAEVERIDDWYLVRDRNPGVSARSIEWLLRLIQDRYGIKDIGLVVDPVNRKICDKLDMDDIMKVARAHPSVKKVYLFEREASGKGQTDGVERIGGIYDVWARHKVVLWCTKEGYL